MRLGMKYKGVYWSLCHSDSGHFVILMEKYDALWVLTGWLASFSPLPRCFLAAFWAFLSSSLWHNVPVRLIWFALTVWASYFSILVSASGSLSPLWLILFKPLGESLAASGHLWALLLSLLILRKRFLLCHVIRWSWPYDLTGDMWPESHVIRESYDQRVMWPESHVTGESCDPTGLTCIHFMELRMMEGFPDVPWFCTLLLITPFDNSACLTWMWTGLAVP